MSTGKTCFIASTIGEENSDERKIANDKFDLVFEPVLKELGYTAIRADKIGTPNSISYDIVKAILESDLMISDVSDLNPNVFYELAVRNSIQKPVIVIKGKNQKMPFDIYDKRAISIDMKEARLWTEAKDHLKKQIIEAEKDKESASKSILTDFSLKPNLQSHLSPSDELSLEMKDIKNEIRNLREIIIEKDVRKNNPKYKINDENFWQKIQERRFAQSDESESPAIMKTLFMGVLKSMEGSNKVAVEERAFVKELERTGIFNEEEARRYIRIMLREASIYESKPGHYNRV